MKRKGVVLAGGRASRLLPMSMVVPKSLMPVYDKPLIFYMLASLIDMGVSEIAIITNPHETMLFQRLLGSGEQWGIHLTYLQQDQPRGVAEAPLVAEAFLAGSAFVLILGDNIIITQPSVQQRVKALAQGARTCIFTSEVDDPERFGVATIGSNGTILNMEEKPAKPEACTAIIGLYMLAGDAPKRARELKPSARGELEIISLLKSYHASAELDVVQLGSDTVWLDVGTDEALLSAANIIQHLYRQHGQRVGSPEQAALAQGFCNPAKISAYAQQLKGSAYGEYVATLLRNESE